MQQARRHQLMGAVLTLGAAGALLSLPAAEAKRLTTVVVAGADGRSVEVPVSLLEPSQPSSTLGGLRGGFVLAYPLIDGGLPARAARVYPSAAALCSSWDTLVTPRRSNCSRLTQAAVRRFSGLHLSRFRTAAPSLRRIASLRSLAAPNNYLAGIELAFHRWREARASARPAACVKVTARWRPAGGRPTAFCLARDGAWANGKLYPYPRAVCRAADLVGSVFAPALPACT